MRPYLSEKTPIVISRDVFTVSRSLGLLDSVVVSSYSSGEPNFPTLWLSHRHQHAPLQGEPRLLLQMERPARILRCTREEYLLLDT